MKTIWIINQYASHLETRHWELAKAFANQGYNVAVLTSSFHHGKREYIFDTKLEFVEKEEEWTGQIARYIDEHIDHFAEIKD